MTLFKTMPELDGEFPVDGKMQGIPVFFRKNAGRHNVKPGIGFSSGNAKDAFPCQLRGMHTGVFSQNGRCEQ